MDGVADGPVNLWDDQAEAPIQSEQHLITGETQLKDPKADPKLIESFDAQTNEVHFETIGNDAYGSALRKSPLGQIYGNDVIPEVKSEGTYRPQKARDRSTGYDDATSNKTKGSRKVSVHSRTRREELKKESDTKVSRL